jgi:hypothetical protein
MPEPLRFYDHHRQRYAGKVPIPEAAEFMIGDYTEEGTVGRDGEFKITLVELHGDRRWSLYPQLEVVGDGGIGPAAPLSTLTEESHTPDEAQQFRRR